MELLARLRVERGEELVFDLPDDRAQPYQLPPALGRERDDVPAAVDRVPVPLDQPALLERVKDPDELAAVERERVGDRRLRVARGLAEQRQHAVVVALEPRLLELLHRAPLDREPEPAEQES